jgi:hypothetical protein
MQCSFDRRDERIEWWEERNNSNLESIPGSFHLDNPNSISTLCHSKYFSKHNKLCSIHRLCKTLHFCWKFPRWRRCVPNHTDHHD